MSICINALQNKPGSAGRHVCVLPIGTVSGVYEIEVSVGRKTVINIGNPGGETFDHIFYNFTKAEATAFGITRVKGIATSANTGVNYNKSALAGVRTVGIDLTGPTADVVTIEVVESK